MICSSFKTVVYASSRPISVATSRTVLGPRVHRIRRMASSASVGFRLGCFMTEMIYEDLRNCQYESFRSSSIGGRPLDAIDHEHVHGKPHRFESQTKLLLDGGEDGRESRVRRLVH